MTTLVNIRCRPLGASLSRSACAQRFMAATGPGRRQVSKLISGACRDCAVGLAHARDEAPTCWADGEPIEEVVHEVEGSALPTKSHKEPAVPAYVPRVRKLTDVPVVGNPTGRNGRPVERYEYRGQMLTARELAALPEAVVDVETIRYRLRRPKRWSPERAVTACPDESKRRRSA